jgi:regulatory protein
MPQSSGRRAIRKAPLLDAAALWDYALKSLGARAQSIGELRRKLLSKAGQPADVESAISRLREYGYLNDNRFAESYAGARLENQGLGRSRVLQDLRQRKVSGELAERTVDRVYGEVDEMELIGDYIDRKLRTKLPLPEALQDPKTLASAYRKLIRAGFRSSNILSALKRIARNHELPDEFDPPDEPPD